MEMALAAEGKPCEAPEGSIRYIARQTLLRAGTDTAAAREIGDRLDGKPAQAIVGGDEDDSPINVVHKIERVIVRPSNSNG